MTDRTIAPYGTWQSPLTPERILAGTVGLSEVVVDGENVYWREGRPQDNGRSVLVCRTPDGRLADVTPSPFSVRTRVHEYGGGSYTVDDGVIYFSNQDDQRLYLHRAGEHPRPLTAPATTAAGKVLKHGLRYADFIVDAGRSRLIAVREDHRPEGREPINTLVAISLQDGTQQILVEGDDFYSSPRLTPDGRRLAWLAWNHPNMPWDGTELWTADVGPDDGLTNQKVVAGSADESIFQPAWSPPDADGRSRLHFVSDRTGWWNLYRLKSGQAEALYPLEAEFGMPQWVFGLATYGFESPTSIICAYSQNGRTVMARLDTIAGLLEPFELPYVLLYPSYGTMQVNSRRLTYVGASPTRPPAVVEVDLTSGHDDVLRRSTTVELDGEIISPPRPIAFPTADGLTAYGYFYEPRSRDFTGPEDERPPLIVTIHGGPTTGARDDLDLEKLYWTSRGFAILDVNYRGSTGFGRPYREQLYGQWGVVDVADCVHGARYLAEQGLVDGDRMIIRGSSAGGYTALCAITFHDVFQAAASHYGISDAELMAHETHKFESRYTDQLLGPYPEARDIYIARSPIHAAGQCSAALILFQGLEDKVTPPNQSETMYEAVRQRGLPVAYLAFEDEGHGFRQMETRRRVLEAELYFYGRVFGFEPADMIEPVPIENLDA